MHKSLAYKPWVTGDGFNDVKFINLRSPLKIRDLNPD